MSIPNQLDHAKNCSCAYCKPDTDEARSTWQEFFDRDCSNCSTLRADLAAITERAERAEGIISTACRSTRIYHANRAEQAESLLSLAVEGLEAIKEFGCDGDHAPEDSGFCTACIATHFLAKLTPGNKVE